MRNAVLMLMMLMSTVALAEKSQLDENVYCPKPVKGTYRVLFVGDSITRHAVNPSTVKDLNWTHVSGMASSSPKSDFVTLLSAKISKDRKQKVVACFHTYGGGGSVASRVAGMPMVQTTSPDLVVIQIGEHDSALSDPVLFHRQFATLVRMSRALPSKPKVIAVGPWALVPLNKNGEYSDPDAAAVDREMYNVAIEESLEYLSVRDIAQIPEAHGYGTDVGVQWHPNDLGHAMYAARLFRLYKAVEQ
ncbi:SGNH/GDSL hydrolase family protein [Pseudomonas sp. FJ2-5-13]|uniref:SGNH/GDSL hydrolase family protein n=1 Tax=unclassified Pseudomonas TaxID=196821 RepID=UPI0008122361|nr:MULTISPECIES: SGNH/GDSL hydrolase family protein [unclassified Pseudomonas]WEJ03485.1 SGNH/GDSL hydrolase family protein [Pseudomonas sp. FJ2-5-13]CRN02106.1 hypothetical protein [Pseudomonas sp. 34 E 7]